MFSLAILGRVFIVCKSTRAECWFNTADYELSDRYMFSIDRENMIFPL